MTMVPDTSGTWTILATSTWTQMQQQFQIYQISAIILFFVILGMLILFRDAFPFAWAKYVSHEVVVGIMDKTTRKIKPNKDFKKYNGMFYYKGEPLPFVKCYPGNFLFAGWPFDILDIDLKVITGPVYRKACRDLIAAGYPNINALEKAVLFSQLKEDDPRMIELISREGYDNYEAARDAINPENLTIESNIVKQFFTACPLSDFLGYGTEVPSDNILGEVDDIYEARKPTEAAKREIMKMLPMAIGIFVFAVIIVIVYVAFFKAKTG